MSTLGITRILYHYFVDEDYLLAKQCQDGAAVLNVSECKKACSSLGISRLGSFKDGRPCYKGGSGVCNQNVKRPGNKATRICKGIEVRNRMATVWIGKEYNIPIVSSICYIAIII